MKKFRIWLIAAVVLLSVGFAGCGGGGTKIEATTTSGETLGKELMDLKKAYDEGAISEKEYERARKDLLKKNR